MHKSPAELLQLVIAKLVLTSRQNNAGAIGTNVDQHLSTDLSINPINLDVGKTNS
jgi:hypothetical protein